MPLYAPTALLNAAFLLTLAAAAPAAGEDGPQGHATVRFLTEMNLVSSTIDVEPLAGWLKPVIQAAEARFPATEGRKAIVVQVTLHRDGPAVLELAGSPALSAEDVEALTAAADVENAPRTKVATCALRVVVKDREGDPDDLPALTPDLETPRARLLAQVEAASSKEGLDLLGRWATEEALPLLAASAAEAEEKFAGVRKLGEAISKALAGPKAGLDVDELAARNPDFWRAALEMKPGDPFAPAVETSLLLAAGRVEWAQQVASLAGMFDANKSGASDLLDFGRILAEAYLKRQQARVGEGIALFDAGKLDEARAAFDAILKDDPQSAWALYEKFHTERTIKLHADEAGEPGPDAAWPATRARILASNPLYPSMAEAHGAEGLFDLSRRAKIETLFQDDRAAARDVVAYADIALDLEAFDMAAMLYWSIIASIPPREYGDRPLLESFLYALERLNVKDVKENFQGDHAAAFAAIEADRRKRIETPAPGDAEADAEADPKPAKP